MLLLDNSAWSRLNSQLLSDERRAEVRGWMAEGIIATCLPFLLEVGYSARSSAEHQTMIDAFDELRRVRITASIERRAQAAQRELAAIGHHRLSPADIVIAACAEEAAAGVLHYDTDYDVLASHTALEFESEWLAPPGTLCAAVRLVHTVMVC